MTALNAMPVSDRIAFANNAPNDQKNTLFADFTPRERETIYAMQNGVGSQYRATRRARPGEGDARHSLRAPVAGGDDRLLVQSLQHLHQQGFGPVVHDRL